MENLPLRMWINQPSTTQIFHKWHGKNVLAVKEGEFGYRCYFLEGDVVSMQISEFALSHGWKTTKE